MVELLWRFKPGLACLARIYVTPPLHLDRAVNLCVHDALDHTC